MALESVAAIQTALGQRLAPKLITLWNRSAVIAAILEAQAGASHNCAWDVEASQTTQLPDTVAEGADMAAAEMQSDLNDAAKLGWADYRTGFNITQRTFDAAASSGGVTADALVDLFEQRLVSKSAALLSKINKDIYAGTGTSAVSSQPNIVGLFGGATDATGTYATLARGTYAEWAGYVSANGGTPRALTLALMALAERNVFINCGETSTHIFVSPGTYSKYEGFFTNVMRISGDSGAGAQAYSAGASSLHYKGIPIIRDKDCPAGKMLFMNANHVKVKFLPPAGKSKDAVMSEMRTLSGKGHDAPVTATAIPFRVEILAKNGSATRVSLWTTIQLATLKPNAFAQVLDIDES
jgi:hypothetical protein